MKSIGSNIQEIKKVPGAIADHARSALIVLMDEDYIAMGEMSTFILGNYHNLAYLIKKALEKPIESIDNEGISVFKISDRYENKYAAVFGVSMYRYFSRNSERNRTYLRQMLMELHRQIKFQGLTRIIMPRIGPSCGIDWFNVVKPAVEEIFSDMHVTVVY